MITVELTVNLMTGDRVVYLAEDGGRRSKPFVIPEVTSDADVLRHVANLCEVAGGGVSDLLDAAPSAVAS